MSFVIFLSCYTFQTRHATNHPPYCNNQSLLGCHAKSNSKIKATWANKYSGWIASKRKGTNSYQLDKKTKHVCNGRYGIVMDICGGWLLIHKILSSISRSLRKDGHMEFDSELLEALKWYYAIEFIRKCYYLKGSKNSLAFK